MSSTKKLKLGEVIEVYEALLKMDGFMRDGKANPYDFDEQTKWNIPKNIRVLKPEYDQWEETRIAKVRELSPEHLNLNRETPSKFESFRSWAAKKRSLETEVTGLLTLKRSNLMKAGPIPSTVISDLMAIIEDDGTPHPPEKKP